MSRSSIRSPASLALALGLALSAKSQVFAQAIEQNLPPEAPHAAVILTPRVEAINRDATPLGPRLTAIVALGPTDTIHIGPSAAGVDFTQSKRLNTPGDRRRLARFIGQPLSRRLIAEVEAGVVRGFRAKGFPLVSVTTPEQDVSTGVLQVRIIEFRLAGKTAPGARDPGYVLSRVRAPAGRPIDVHLLAQDLDWLNRYPFRRSEAAFQPATILGATNLILQTTSSKPWSVYAGYGDSGSPLTGFDRYFAGATVALPFLHDAYAAYQFTGSNDVLFSGSRPFDTAPDPRYLSHSGRIVVPTLPRQDVEASFSYVVSNEAQDFTARQVTEEASLSYRSALSNLWSRLPGEAALGVEARRETGRTLFAGEPVQNGGIDVFQVTAAYAGQEADALGRTSFELTLHLSPGGVSDRNTDAVFAAASQGRSRTAEYGYVSGDFNRSVALPRGLSYDLSIVGQYAPNPLPLTEQIGLGGASLVRGYTPDDGVFDSGLAARNELRAPAFPLLARRFAPMTTDALQPFTFLDAAWGKNDFTRADASLFGAGLGANYALGRHLTADLTAAWALKQTGLTTGGRFRVVSRVVFTF